MAEKANFIMDPDGDVFLTLINPDAPFAVWDDSGSNSNQADKQDPDDGPTPEPAPDVTFLLSSRHLSLASPVLKTMLSGRWIEGVKAESESLLHLTAEDWDREALAAVMNIVHGRWSLVPRTVSFEMLAKIAVVIDYYDIREPLNLIISLWMEKFNVLSVPTSFGREMVLWVLVSWVFKEKSLFRRATKLAILQSTNQLDIPGDIPIPSSIIVEINARRRALMKGIADFLTELRQGYIVGRNGCDFECSSMHLGALMKGLHALKFFDENPPDAPFGDLSLMEVVEKLQKIKSPTWCTVPLRCGCRDGGYHYGNTSCPTCPKAHVCSQEPTSFSFWDLHLGVGFYRSTSEGALSQHAIRFLQTLQNEVVMKLELF